MEEMVLSLTLKYCGETLNMLTEEKRDNMDPLVISESYLSMLVDNCGQLSVKFFKDYLKDAEIYLDHSLPGATCSNKENVISDKAPIQETNGEELPSSSIILTSSPPPNEKPINLGSACVPPVFESHSSQRNEDLTIGGGTDELPRNLVKAAAKETLQPEPEHNTFYETSEADITFNQHAQKTKKKYEAHEEFWKTNKEKIKKDCNTRPDGDALNFALTYSKEKKIEYRLFHSDQNALSWAYKNVHHMDEFPPFIQIWQLKAIKRPLMTIDLEVTSIKLTHPLEPNNVILQKKGLPDTFSDSAFIPFDPYILNKLINSAMLLNGELVPTVYGKLTICGEELKNIYEIELDSDGESCAIGLPQMMAISKSCLERIMKEYINIFVLDEFPRNLVKTAAKEILQPELELNTLYETSEEVITFNQHMREIKKKYEAHEAFWKKNKEKIKKHRNTRPDGDALNFALTYSKEKKIKYRLFHSDQNALSWAYKKVKNMDEFPPFIRIWQLKAIKRPLMTTDLKVTSIELTHPLEPNNVILEMKGLPDTFSDSAFIPFDPHISNKLINSATILNGELVPTVYGKLTICGEELKNIYEIELDRDGESTAIGVPQLYDMMASTRERMMKECITKLSTS